MLSDRAMWGSVVLVDHLRNGLSLEGSATMHAARSLAALMNAFRLPLDEYWERQMDQTDGGMMVWLLSQAGYAGFGVPSDLVKNEAAISKALAERSWDALSELPTPVWGLLKAGTGMSREEWAGLPDFCRGLLSERIICPDCLYTASIDSFGEPNPIDDPTYVLPQRIRLVFRCPKCGTEVTYGVTSGKSWEQSTKTLGNSSWLRWIIIGIFLGGSILCLLGYMYRGGR